MKKGKYIKCKICNKKFYCEPWEIKGGRKFCSYSCYWEYSKGKPRLKARKGKLVNCKTCNKEFWVIQSNLKEGKGKFCSINCYNKSKKGNPRLSVRTGKLMECKICNKEFYCQPFYFTKKFCSHKCYWESMLGKTNLAMTGSNHPNWLDGASFKPYATDWTETLREAIRQRDNYICQLCRINQEELTGYHKKLCVHHIDYNKKNCCPENLIILCSPCNSMVNFNREYWTEYFQVLLAKREVDVIYE